MALFDASAEQHVFQKQQQVRNRLDLNDVEWRENGSQMALLRGGHTLANLLRHQLLADSDRVAFVGYTKPHPLDDTVLLEIDLNRHHQQQQQQQDMPLHQQ
jgi:DNA-directed RNA polymerase subunit L